MIEATDAQNLDNNLQRTNSMRRGNTLIVEDNDENEIGDTDRSAQRNCCGNG